MSTRILFLVLSLSVVLVTAAAGTHNIPSPPATSNCSAGDNARANELFVKAAKLIQQTKRGDPRDSLNEAQKHFENIIKKYPCTDLAVRLISSQEIGNISIAALEARIQVLGKQLDDTSCSKFCDAVTSALKIPDPEARDPVLASIARKQARANDFPGAFETIELISDGDERKRLRRYASRARVRADLRCEQPMSCP